MFVDSQLLLHKKSQSVSELAPAIKKSSTSPQTSPLLKRALSPSEIRRKGTRPRRSVTLPREIKKRSPKVVSIVVPQREVEEVEGEEELEEATTLL